MSDATPAASGSAELVVLAIHIVDDLTERLEGGVGKAEAGHQGLEAAAVALVGEFALVHVEPELTRQRGVPLGRHELEPRLRVDEPPDQPRAGDPVYLDARSGYPRGAADRHL